MGDLAEKFPSLAAKGAFTQSSMFQKSFVSEREIETKKRDVVRDRAAPAQAPVQEPQAPRREYDTRSLAERLAEARAMKRQAQDDMMRFSNLIKTVDEDESQFLQDVAKDEEQSEKALRDLIAAELARFQAEQNGGQGAANNIITAVVAEASPSEVDPKLLKPDLKPLVPPKRDFQRDLLTSGVLRKKARTGETSSAATAGATPAASKSGNSKPDDPKSGEAKLVAAKAAAKPAAGALLGLDYGSDNEEDAAS